MIQSNRIIDRILEKIPPIQHTSISLVSSRELFDCQAVALQVAAGLVRRDLGPVLLVDCESQGSLSDHLGLKQRSGLKEMVEKQEDWHALVHETLVPGLQILPAGNCNVSPRTLTKSRILEFLKVASAEYRYVLLASGSVKTPHAKAIASAADATCLVINLAGCDQQEVSRTVRDLTEFGARTIGCITTDVNH